jgi:hypothetical protein
MQSRSTILSAALYDFAVPPDVAGHDAYTQLDGTQVPATTGLAFIDGSKGCYNALTVWENGCFVDELLEGGKHVA